MVSKFNNKIYWSVYHQFKFLLLFYFTYFIFPHINGDNKKKKIIIDNKKQEKRITKLYF